MDLRARVPIVAALLLAPIASAEFSTEPSVEFVSTRSGAGFALEIRGTDFDDAELDELLHEVRTAAYRIIEGKGATNLAIGLSTARILAAIDGDEHAVLPVSARHRVPEVGEVCMSLPTVVGRHGVGNALEVPMTERERAGLLASAAAIRYVIDQIGG